MQALTTSPGTVGAPGVALPRTTVMLREALEAAAPDAMLRVSVQLEPGDDGAQLARFAAQHSATLLDPTPQFGDVARADVPAAAIGALAAQPWVVVLDDAGDALQTLAPRTDGHTPSTRNADSLDSSNADEVVPGGAAGLDLTGEGVLLGVFDGGPIRVTHGDFGGRVSYLDPDGFYDAHATHVTGTMVGSGAARADARGFAPGARAFGWTFEIGDTIARMVDVSTRFVASNHSYGYDLGWDRTGRWVGDSGFGVYGQDARRTDLAIREYDIIWVKAAGNDAGQGQGFSTPTRPSDCSTGFDCIASDGAAKNQILVAAALDLTRDPASPGDARATSFSSRGPMDDGRVKPDIAANGDSLLSVGSDADDAYVRLSGTSMAAPSVTGGIALLAEHIRDTFGRDPGAAEMRGLLAHTALRNDDEGRPVPTLGWGMMDVAAAVAFLDDAASERLLVHGIYDGTPQSFTMRPGDDRDVELTLVWLDPAGRVNTGGADDPTPALVNDLDVRAATGGTTHYPWRLTAGQPELPAVNDGPNRVDNLERIVIPASDVGSEVSVTLNHDGALSGAQPFVLLASHAVTVPDEVPRIGAMRTLRLRVQNDADPVTQPLPVTMLAGGSAAFTVERVEAPFWLSLDATEGTVPGDLPTMTVDARGLSPTLHYATLRIENTTTPEDAVRWLTVVLDVRGLEFPEVNAGDDRTVPSGAHVRLNGSGSDPTGEPVTLLWSQTAGPTVSMTDADTGTLRFDAPTVDRLTTLRFELVASNGSLTSAPGSVEVDVIPTNGPNEPADNRCATAPRVGLPYSGGGELSPVHDVDYVRFDLLPGETITASTFRRGDAIDTTIALTSDTGDILTTDDDGGADLYSAFEDRVDEGGTYCVAVSTYADFDFDGAGAEDEGTYGLTIEVDRPNQPPVANAGTDQLADPGTIVELDGTASSDPDGTSLRFAWTQVSGPDVTLDDETSPRPRFAAPSGLAAAADIVFSLEVTDTARATDDDDVVVSVGAGAGPGTVADAGPDRTVVSGARVTLVGAGFGDVSALAWTSDDVSVNDLGDGRVAFDAPEVDAATTLTLRLTATGTPGDTDEVVVTVVPTTGADEPANNRCSTAPLIGRGALVPIRETIAGALEPRHDVDFVRFDVLDGTSIRVDALRNGPAMLATLGVFREGDDGWEPLATAASGDADALATVQLESTEDGVVCVGISHARDIRFDGVEADGDGPYLLAFEVEPPEGANTPPTAVAGDDREVDPGALVELDGTASVDPEAQPMDYTWRQVGGTRTLDIFDGLSATAQVIVPNDLPATETYRFELRVFDGVYEDTDVVGFTVGPNQRPILSPVDRIEVELGEDVTFTVDAGDPDGDSVRLIAEELPATASFDAETGTFTWTSDEAGFFTPRIEAIDPFGALDEEFVTVIVIDRATENRPPTVQPIASQELLVDEVPTNVRLEAIATDPDGDELDYFWELDDGTFLGATAVIEPSWGYGAYDGSVFVSDGAASTSTSFSVVVRSASDEPPIGDAGLDQRVGARTGAEPATLVYLDGRGSFDPLERGPLAYAWTQVGGGSVDLVDSDAAVASFETPIGEGALEFELIVTALQDGREVPGQPVSTFVRLEDEFVNGAPAALIEGPAEVTVGEATTYSGTSSSDPENDGLSWHWVLDGPGAIQGTETEQVRVTFAESASRTWALSLMVHDGEVYSAPTTREIREQGVTTNRAPEARGRLVGVPRSGTTVQLDASASTDADDDALTFAWAQVDGTPQTLSAGDTAEASVTLEATAGELLTFEVTVDDGRAFDTALVSFEVIAGTGGEGTVDAGSPDVGTGLDAGADAGAGTDSEGGGSGGGCAQSGQTRGTWVGLLALGFVCVRRRKA